MTAKLNAAFHKDLDQIHVKGSDTPRTDAHITELRRNPEVSGCNRTLEFVRQLERELAASKEFLDNFGILSGAGVGVILTRTREPHRAEETLKVWAFSQKRSFRSWNVDVYTALKKINDVDGTGANAWQNSLSVVHYAHWVWPKHSGMMQLMKEYARDFSETKQRVVLLVPEGFMLPSELQNYVTVLDFELPKRGKIVFRKRY